MRHETNSVVTVVVDRVVTPEESISQQPVIRAAWHETSKTSLTVRVAKFQRQEIVFGGYFKPGILDQQVDCGPVVYFFARSE